MHHAPLVLAERDDHLEDALAQIVDRIEHDHMKTWLENRKQEFLAAIPS